MSYFWFSNLLIEFTDTTPPVIDNEKENDEDGGDEDAKEKDDGTEKKDGNDDGKQHEYREL